MVVEDVADRNIDVVVQIVSIGHGGEDHGRTGMTGGRAYMRRSGLFYIGHCMLLHLHSSYSAPPAAKN